MDITYLSEIKNALVKLNGCGSLKEICACIEQNNVLPAIHTNKSWDRNVSAVIQRHCKQTKSYKGAENIFYSVYGLGEGFWGLRSFASEKKEEITPIEKRQIDLLSEDKNIDITEKEAIIKARVGQGLFRNRLIEKYHKCLITGIDDTRLLLASHIKPWRSSNNMERLSSENGLLLSPLYDKLFDLGLISFTKKATVIISSEISDINKSRLNIDTNHAYMRDISDELLRNLEYHRDVIFKG